MSPLAWDKFVSNFVFKNSLSGAQIKMYFDLVSRTFQFICLHPILLDSTPILHQ